jgi:hypothetical protein
VILSIGLNGVDRIDVDFFGRRVVYVAVEAIERRIEVTGVAIEVQDASGWAFFIRPLVVQRKAM